MYKCVNSLLCVRVGLRTRARACVRYSARSSILDNRVYRRACEHRATYNVRCTSYIHRTAKLTFQHVNAAMDDRLYIVDVFSEQYHLHRHTRTTYTL